MAARAFGASSLDRELTPYQILFSFLAEDEKWRWIIEDLLVPKLLWPLMKRLDDVMDNIVRSDTKDFSTHYRSYWMRRQQEATEEEKRLRERAEGKTPEDSLPNQTSPEDADINSNLLRGTQEQAGHVSFSNLQRSVDIASDIIQDLFNEESLENSVLTAMRDSMVKTEMEGIHAFDKPKFEIKPDIVVKSKDDTQRQQEIIKQAQDILDKSTADLLAKLESGGGSEFETFTQPTEPPPIDETEYTRSGDKKLSLASVVKEEDFMKDRAGILEGLWQEKTGLVFSSLEEHNFYAVEQYVKEQGFNSYEELLQAQEKTREEEAAQMAIFKKQKLESINLHRRAQNLSPLLDIAVNNVEFEEWLNKKG